jgi:hypothetical protein
MALHKTQAFGVASVRIEGSEREWGFGQFLPVLLLALPLFAGWESFWGNISSFPTHCDAFYLLELTHH